MITVRIEKDDSGWFRVYDAEGNILISTDVYNSVETFLFFHL